MFISFTHDAGQGLHSGTDSPITAMNILHPAPPAFSPLAPPPKKPMIASSQTAIVTDPAAEEIHTNAHGTNRWC